MDIEQKEMQFLGLLGIYAQSYKLIFNWPKIFTQITLSLVLPLSFIFLGHEEISENLYWKLRHNEYRLHRTKTGTPRYTSLSDLVSSEWVTYILFKASYFTFLLVFSLLSTSAVVYTVASIYTSREITFKRVISVVPKVWKRLMVTFLCAFIAFFAYNTVFGLTLFFWAMTLSDIWIISYTLLWVVLILYVLGFIYLTIVWLLASVVTVLEDSYGFKAMIRSKDLIKGKIMVAIVIFFKLNFTFVVINIVFRLHVVFGWGGLGIWQRIGVGLLCVLLLFKLILFALVVQSVVYFVCKSYHHENIDKSVLSDHLEEYLGEYVPLKAMDVQLEEYHV